MKWSLLSFAALLVPCAQAQNLVGNGDFEQYTQCPDYVSQIDRAVGWSRPTNGTSDYFNACLGVPFSESVPDNEFGYQAAHSGNGYAGFYCFYSTTAITTAPDNDHEYVTHALSSPLIPGLSYSVEFFVSLADVSKYAVNDIGALLSTTIPHRTDEYAITATPQITNTSLAMLNDKSSWARIHGCFVADSAYVYITIGNFHVGPATVFQEVSTNYPLIYYSYYYVDDVSVRPIEAPELGPDITTCSTATLTVMNPVTGANYTWSTGESGTSINVDTSGSYTVTMEADGCMVSDSIHVFAAEPLVLRLPADTAVDFCTVNALSLAVEALPADAVIVWSTGSSTPSIPVGAAGSYSVHVSAPGYCAASATIDVTDLCITPVYAPNAFTPNGDGFNDAWQPVWRANANAEVEFTVFDRWGGVVYHAATRDATWDGTVNGTPVPAGVYAWTGHAWDPVTKARSAPRGHVLLLR